MTVERICVRRVDVAKPGESVQVGARRMQSRKVGTLVIVNSTNEPIGIVTDRDLAMRVLAEALDPALTPLSEVMTAPVTTVSEDTPIEEALRFMRVGACRRLPVTDAAGKLTGLVSLDDVLDLLSHEFREIGRLLVEENPGSLVGEWAPSVE
jgi:CBS domain-containing protein